jgi:hypothetical protein
LTITLPAPYGGVLLIGFQQRNDGPDLRQFFVEQVDVLDERLTESAVLGFVLADAVRVIARKDDSSRPIYYRQYE